MIRQFQINKED